MTDMPETTVIENVPLTYQPQFVPASSGVVIGPSQVKQGLQFIPHSTVSCFGAGTLVRSLSGPRAIESLLVGDLVLSQDIKTGRLGYRPITVVHHNPPSPTYVITAGGDPIVSSHFHRFWVAGKGWVMARDLKAGDRVRALGGVEEVSAVEADRVQPVFNLEVAGGHSFLVGRLGALVHDNSLVEPVPAPFDGPTLAAVVKPAR